MFMKKPHKRSATKVDSLIGSKIRFRRGELGLSQKEFADLLGVSFQQLQKYEGGSNRVSVSRLMDICAALRTTPSYFLDGLDSALPQEALFETDSKSLQLLQYYHKITQPDVKHQLLQLAKSLAS